MDEVICPGIEGPELAGRALAALRKAGWARPPVRIEVRKRIPVAAGLGGGSADAAAVLRMARGEVDGLEEIAAHLGADVPSQLDPRPSLVTGAGEGVEPIEALLQPATVIVPGQPGLATADVYAEADRLGVGRGRAELEAIAGRLRKAVAEPVTALALGDLLVNDLEAAALSLRPELAGVLAELRDAGASHAAITGSGPTAFALFAQMSERLAGGLRARFPGAIVQ